jgi:hypothetical protein
MATDCAMKMRRVDRDVFTNGLLVRCAISVAKVIKATLGQEVRDLNQFPLEKNIWR